MTEGLGNLILRNHKRCATILGMKKLRVAVLYGGRSGEHEVSLRSASSVIRHLDKLRFDVIPVGIDKQGRWHLGELPLLSRGAAGIPDVLPMISEAPLAVLPPNPIATAVANPATGELIELAGHGTSAFDVVFPVMHGPLCEDGTIQGLLELAEVPYVGCGVLASAVGMDKDVAKRLARDAGIPIVPYISLKKGEWKKRLDPVMSQIDKEFGYPVFVKPANQGSSVGVHRVKQRSELAAALEDAFRYDTKLLIEKAVNAREIEISVLENPKDGEAPMVSVPGEVASTHEFYSYEAKYLDENGAALMIPAKLEPAQAELARKMAGQVFSILECEGMARCDLFLDKKTGEFYFNEVNTIPGFTSISMYPKMWEATGIPYSELLTRLIELAIARHARKKALVREFTAGERGR